jgi:hypothetical protein
MPTQNEPEQLDMFECDPVCKMHGCQQQKHLRSIRELQAIIAKLEEELDDFDNQE